MSARGISDCGHNSGILSLQALDHPRGHRLREAKASTWRSASMQIIRYQSSDGTIAPGWLRSGKYPVHSLPAIERHPLLHWKIGKLRPLEKKRKKRGWSKNKA